MRRGPSTRREPRPRPIAPTIRAPPQRSFAYCGSHCSTNVPRNPVPSGARPSQGAYSAGIGTRAPGMCAWTRCPQAQARASPAATGEKKWLLDAADSLTGGRRCTCGTGAGGGGGGGGAGGAAGGAGAGPPGVPRSRSSSCARRSGFSELIDFPSRLRNGRGVRRVGRDGSVLDLACAGGGGGAQLRGLGRARFRPARRVADHRLLRRELDDRPRRDDVPAFARPWLSTSVNSTSPLFERKSSQSRLRKCTWNSRAFAFVDLCLRKSRSRRLHYHGTQSVDDADQSVLGPSTRSWASA